MSARENLLALLREHAGGALEADEAAMTLATIAFVEMFPDCAERSLEIGHLTGSAWVVDATRTRVLLTHHRKLERWLQLGGHADGDLDICRVAFREAQEESGLRGLQSLSPQIFDVDRHWIPERSDEPAHWHYDLRFLVEGDFAEPLVISVESKDLTWVNFSRIESLTTEPSIRRMVRKTLLFKPASH